MRVAAGLVVAPAEATLGRRPETFQLAGLDDLLVLVSMVVAPLGRIVAVRLFGLRLRGSRSAPGTCSGGRDGGLAAVRTPWTAVCAVKSQFVV